MAAISIYEPNIDEWIYLIEGNHIEHCREQDLLIRNIVRPVLERDDVYVDAERIAKGLSLQKYFPFKLLPWEKFLFAMIVGVFLRKPGEPDDILFNYILILLGRGAGKNGFIDFLAFYFISPYHGVTEYNVDLIANGEDQAKTSIKDVYNLLEKPVDPKFARTLKSNYRWTLEEITGKAMNATFRLNTTSTKNKDSKRTGCVIYDEKHQYTDTANMDTLSSGLGKVKWGREITISTDGLIRGGVLDQEKAQAQEILRQYDPHNRSLPFICKIEDESEWNQIDKLVKANPSLLDPSFSALRTRIEREIAEMPSKPHYYPTFLAKRCNFPKSDPEKAVADWDTQIIPCCRQPERPVADGERCVGGVDYSKTNDFVSCVLVFRRGEELTVKHHTFICEKSADLPSIKAPIQDWCDQGICEIVHDVEIPPRLVAEWFAEAKRHFDVRMIGIDTYRWTLLNKAFKDAGFEAVKKGDRDVWLARPSDVEKIAPVVSSLFATQKLSGFDRMLCWYTNNTMEVRHKNGNIRYEKIEPKLRKTDGFMALVHALCCLEWLPEETTADIFPLQVMTF